MSAMNAAFSSTVFEVCADDGIDLSRDHGVATADTPPATFHVVDKNGYTFERFPHPPDH